MVGRGHHDLHVLGHGLPAGDGGGRLPSGGLPVLGDGAGGQPGSLAGDVGPAHDRLAAPGDDRGFLVKESCIPRRAEQRGGYLVTAEVVVPARARGGELVDDRRHDGPGVAALRAQRAVADVLGVVPVRRAELPAVDAVRAGGQRGIAGVVVLGHEDRVVMARGVDLGHHRHEVRGGIGDNGLVLSLGPEAAGVHGPAAGPDRAARADPGQPGEAPDGQPEALVVAEVQVEHIDLVRGDLADELLTADGGSKWRAMSSITPR